MSDHLSEKEIDSLSRRTSRGSGLFAALKHLETCPECRSRVQLPTEQEILEKLGINERSDAKNNLTVVAQK